jgi:hypothetical protein
MIGGSADLWSMATLIIGNRTRKFGFSDEQLSAVKARAATVVTVSQQVEKRISELQSLLTYYTSVTIPVANIDISGIVARDVNTHLASMIWGKIYI